MIMFSTRARVTGSIPDAMTWAYEIAQIVTTASGVPIEVAARVGGFNDVIWVSRLDNMAAIETMMGKVQESSEYQAGIRKALDKKLFDTATVEQAFWRVA